MNARLLLTVHAAATLYLTGLVWFVQVVHYPLFSKVGLDSFARYESEHLRLTGYVVALPMLVELITGGSLLVVRPRRAPVGLLSFGVILLVVIWISTFFVQVPAHDMLAGGFDVDGWKLLIASNWVRTVAWTARSAIVLYLLARG